MKPALDTVIHNNNNKSIENSELSKITSNNNNNTNTIDSKSVDRSSGTGLGRRKSSVARAWIFAKSNDNNNNNGDRFSFMVNSMDASQYFHHNSIAMGSCLLPLLRTNTISEYTTVRASVKGGGVMGQAGAIRLGEKEKRSSCSRLVVRLIRFATKNSCYCSYDQY